MKPQPIPPPLPALKGSAWAFASSAVNRMFPAGMMPIAQQKWWESRTEEILHRFKGVLFTEEILHRFKGVLFNHFLVYDLRLVDHFANQHSKLFLRQERFPRRFAKQGWAGWL